MSLKEGDIMDIKKIEYNRELIKNKIRLQNELKIVDEKIRTQQENCNHVTVELNYADYTSFNDFRVCYDCVLCGKKDVYPIERLVDARKYLRSKYNDNASSEQRKEKFNILQELAWELIQENPSMKEDELAEKLQKMVDKNKEPGKISELGEQQPLGKIKRL